MPLDCGHTFTPVRLCQFALKCTLSIALDEVTLLFVRQVDLSLYLCACNSWQVKEPDL